MEKSSKGGSDDHQPTGKNSAQSEGTAKPAEARKQTAVIEKKSSATKQITATTNAKTTSAKESTAKPPPAAAAAAVLPNPFLNKFVPNQFRPPPAPFAFPNYYGPSGGPPPPPPAAYNNPAAAAAAAQGTMMHHPAGGGYYHHNNPTGGFIRTGYFPPPPHAAAVQNAERPPEYYARWYSLPRLSFEKANNTELWKQLNFEGVDDRTLNELFPLKAKGGAHFNPPPSYRKSIRKIREWRRFGIKQQRQLIEEEEKKAESTALSKSPRGNWKRQRTEPPNLEQLQKQQQQKDKEAKASSSGETTTTTPRNHRKRPNDDEANAMAASWDGKKSDANTIGTTTRPYRQTTFPCSGITLDFLHRNTRLGCLDATIAEGFRYLVGAAMHQLGSAISNGDDEEWSLGPFPHRGALFNKRTKEKDLLLVENTTPMEIFLHESARSYGFRAPSCLLTVIPEFVEDDDGAPLEPPVCENCKKEISKNLMRRLKSAVEKRSMSDEALKGSTLDTLDCPELLRKRIQIANKDIYNLRMENRGYKRREARSEEKKQELELTGALATAASGLAATGLAPKSSSVANLSDDEEVLDGDALMARLGFRL